MKSFSKILLHHLRRQHLRAAHKGVTLVELLAVVTITGVLAAIAVPSISFGTEPLQDTTTRIASNFKTMRIKAMSQTSAYRVRRIPGATEPVVIERASQCSQADADWSRDPSYVFEDLEFDDGVDIQAVTLNGADVLGTDWRICFNNRGQADQTLNLTLQDEEGVQEQIQVFRGGIVFTTIQARAANP